MSRSRTGVGVIGAGIISDTYLENLVSFPTLEVLFLADIDTDRAAAQAIKHGVPGHGTVEELLEVDEIEIVVNLTVPAAHVPVSLAAIGAGKHVWSEKPFAVDREGGRELLAAADAAGVRVAAAPDTILGAGLQTARKIVEDGQIGVPQSAIALLQSRGPDRWHPNPEFLFAKGAGPLFDMGPYYITSLVQLLGPVAKVTATGSQSRSTRVIASGPKAGTEFGVEVPTHVSVLLEFSRGASALSVLSFDSAFARIGFLELTGTTGGIKLPDPNKFDGDTTLYTNDHPDGHLVVAQGHKSSRGTGVVELAQAIRENRPERASGELAYHVLDVLVSISESITGGGGVRVDSTTEPAPLLPAGWDPQHIVA